MAQYVIILNYKSTLEQNIFKKNMVIRDNCLLTLQFKKVKKPLK